MAATELTPREVVVGGGGAHVAPFHRVPLSSLPLFSLLSSLPLSLSLSHSLSLSRSLALTHRVSRVLGREPWHRKKRPEARRRMPAASSARRARSGRKPRSSPPSSRRMKCRRAHPAPTASTRFSTRTTPTTPHCRRATTCTFTSLPSSWAARPSSRTPASRSPLVTATASSVRLSLPTHRATRALALAAVTHRGPCAPGRGAPFWPRLQWHRQVNAPAPPGGTRGRL